MAIERFNNVYLGTSHVTGCEYNHDVITSHLNNSNNIFAGVYIYLNTNQVYFFLLILIKIQQNCASQALILLCIAIFRNRSHDCQIKMAAH